MIFAHWLLIVSPILPYLIPVVCELIDIAMARRAGLGLDE